MDETSSLTQERSQAAGRVPRGVRWAAFLALFVALLSLTSTGAALLRVAFALVRLAFTILLGPLIPPISFELVSVGVLLALAWYAPRRLAGWIRPAFRALGRVEQKWAVLLTGVLAAASAAATSAFVHWPEPIEQDEFAYLLLGDTFSAGRLTNPTHPHWIHFETMHVVQQPTYTAKYPPAQGIMLAVGQWLGGHPLVGVWLSVGLAASALSWMFWGWLPPRWAVLGGVLAAVRLTFWGWPSTSEGAATLTAAYWSQSYWGGAVAAAGGALVFGAYPRILRQPTGSRAASAVLLGLGLAVLANSRPYEGLLVCLPVAAGLALWMFGRNGPPVRDSLLRVALPLGLVLAATGLAMAGYNYRVTGHPLRIPYTVYNETYTNIPKFIWQPLGPTPALRHQAMRDHLDAEIEFYSKRQSLGVVWEVARRSMRYGRQFAGPALMPALGVVLVLGWRVRSVRFLLFVCGVLYLGLMVETYCFPHYAAPITGVVFLLGLQGLRLTALWRPGGKPTGLVLAFGLPLICGLTVILILGQKAADAPRFTEQWAYQRARIHAQLAKDAERHLVLVQYVRGHNPYEEWVYNAADIDGAKVVWARSLGPERDRALIGYFHDRRVWLLEADASPPRLRSVLLD